MKQFGVRGLICVTGVGAGETKGHGGFLYDRILYPLFTKGIDWTIPAGGKSPLLRILRASVG